MFFLFICQVLLSRFLFASAVLAAISCLVIFVWFKISVVYIYGGITCVLELLAEIWAISEICHHVRCNSRPQQQVSHSRKIDNK